MIGRPRRAVQSAGYHVPGLVVAERGSRGEIGVAAFERLDELARVSGVGVGDVYDLYLAAVVRRRQRRAFAVDGQVVDLLGRKDVRSFVFNSRLFDRRVPGTRAGKPAAARKLKPL